MIYVIGGTKGGSGKTTFAVNLAVLLFRLGRDVLLMDADDQGTATDFYDMRSDLLGGETGYTSTQSLGKAVGTQVQQMAGKYDDIVVDAGGRDTTSQRAALVVADVFVCPFKPRSFDMWTAEKVAEIVEEVHTINPDLKSYAFLNMADSRGRDNEEAATLFEDYPQITFINAPLGHRKVFANAGAFGQGVIEYKKPKDVKAIEEFLSLGSKVTGLDVSALLHTENATV